MSLGGTQLLLQGLVLEGDGVPLLLDLNGLLHSPLLRTELLQQGGVSIHHQLLDVSSLPWSPGPRTALPLILLALILPLGPQHHVLP